MREQLEKTRQKEAEKADAKDAKHAQLLLAKIEPAVASLEALLNHPTIALISEAIVSPVKQSLDKFYEAVGLARRVIKNGNIIRRPLLIASARSCGLTVMLLDNAKYTFLGVVSSSQRSKHDVVWLASSGL